MLHLEGLKVWGFFPEVFGVGFLRDRRGRGLYLYISVSYSEAGYVLQILFSSVLQMGSY